MNTYTLHITIYHPLFLGAIFVGLNFVLQLWFTKKVNQGANRFLALALLAMVLWIIWLVGIDLGLGGYFPLRHWLPLQFSLALGPLIYFYVRKTVLHNYNFRVKDWLHFIPVLLQQGAVALNVRKSVGNSMPAFTIHLFQHFNTAMQLATFLSVIIYLYGCFRWIERFYTQIEFNDWSDRYRNDLNWLQHILQRFGLIWLLWIPYTAVDYLYYHNQAGLRPYYSLFLILIISMIWIAAKVFSRPEIEARAAQLPIPKTPASAALRKKANWLKHTIQQNRYYQDPELSVVSLAEKLGISARELSHIINTALKKNFNDFINEYRVKDVAAKMQDPAYQHITLLGIAYEAGFNSKSTFNRFFKQITGKSPIEYKAELKKGFPNHVLRRSPLFAKVISNHETTLKWHNEKLNRNYMFKNYLKIARRNLMRNKSYAAINVTGLAVGIAVCITIFIIIQYQNSFDTFHSKKDQIYRVLTEYHHQDAGNISYAQDLAFPIPRGLKTAFPQIEQLAPIFESHDDGLLIPDENGVVAKMFKEQRGVFFTSPSFFEIFDFPLLAGSYASLKDPNNVLITKEIAEKYFGDWKLAMGKTINLQSGGFIFEHGTDVLKVSGILATIPTNTDFKLKLVVAFGTGFTGAYFAKNTDWNTTVSDFGCYLLMPANTSVDNFNQQLGAYSRKVETSTNKDSHIIQPLSAVHYDTGVDDYSNKTISRQLLNVLWLIAAFILFIACVNFINLSTAQAVNRAKEVGVRKVLGSNKMQLQMQFIVETFLIVISAVALAAGITTVALPYVSKLLDLSLSFNPFGNPSIIFFLLAVTIVVTALAGFYPSIVYRVLTQ